MQKISNGSPDVVERRAVDVRRLALPKFDVVVLAELVAAHVQPLHQPAQIRAHPYPPQVLEISRPFDAELAVALRDCHRHDPVHDVLSSP
jgi:hypothetical protein